MVVSVGVAVDAVAGVCVAPLWGWLFVRQFMLLTWRCPLGLDGEGRTATLQKLRSMSNAIENAGGEDLLASTAVTVVSTELAPKAVGPYSQAIRTGNFIFCSGQIPLSPETGEVVGKSTAEQAEQALTNLAAVVEAAGSDLAHVVKTTVFLVDMGDFAEVNAVYAKYFAENPPARSAVQVGALPKGVRVEVEAVAVLA